MTIKPSKPSSNASLNFSIDQLPALSAEDCTKLKNHGITTTIGLLKKAGASRSQKEALAIALGVRLQVLLKWLAIADLARIPAVGLEYSGVILHSGIASIDQLVQTPLDKLHKQILRLQVQNFQRADLCPSIDQMALWIKQAQKTNQ
ncbi:MAG: DUF4332 domain-containing protein [Pseudanabaena sp. ELA748]